MPRRHATVHARPCRAEYVHLSSVALSVASQQYLTPHAGQRACTSLPANLRVSVTVTVPCSCADRTEAAAFAAAKAASAAALTASDAPPVACISGKVTPGMITHGEHDAGANRSELLT